MEQNGRKAYETEIKDLQDKITDAEYALETYDDLYKKFYAAMPKQSNPLRCVDRAVQRAINDAYMQWKEDTGL